MAQPYVGETRMFAGNFAPAGWAFCSGQLLPISENETLFQLIGTTYGGDGQSTFALPDLQGRLPVHQGQGPGIGQNYTLAQMAGVEEVTLNTNQIPLHNHAMLAVGLPGSSASPSGVFYAKSTSNTPYTNDTSTGLIPLNNTTILPLGGSQPHSNFQPYLCVNFIISLFGLFPTQ